MENSKSKARRIDDDDDELDDDEVEEEVLLDDDDDNDEIEEEVSQKKRKRGRSSGADRSKKSKKKQKTKSASTLTDEKKKKILEEGRRTARKEFEQHKEKVLSKIPKKYKANFGQIGFTKWNKNLIPVLILSPFQVPPGEVRQTWEDMFQKKESAGTLHTMSYLIYWYGAQDESSFFGFIAQKAFVPYEKEAAKGSKGCHMIPPKLQSKVDKKVPLNMKEKEKVNAYREMEEDLKKKPSERVRGILNFPECYDLLGIDDVEEISSDGDEEGDDDESSDDGEELSDVSSVLAEKNNESPTKAVEQEAEPIQIIKKGRRESMTVDGSGDETVQTGRNKTTIDDIGDIDSDEEDKKPTAVSIPRKSVDKVDVSKEKTEVKRAKPKKKVFTAEDNEEEDEEEEILEIEKRPSYKNKKKEKTLKGKILSELDSVANKGGATEKERSKSKDNKKARKKKFMVESDGENSNADDEKEHLSDEDDTAHEVQREKKKPGRKKKIIAELDKKQQNEAKNSRSSMPPPTTKKAMFDKPSVDVEDEQILFQECERRHLAKINRWKECLEANDLAALDVVISRLVKVIALFTAPFVQSYGILALIKQTESLVPSGDIKLKLLKANLFSSYGKKKDNVPKGFKPVLGQVPIIPWTEEEVAEVEEPNENVAEKESMKKESIDDDEDVEVKQEKIKSKKVPPKKKATKPPKKVKREEDLSDEEEEAEFDDKKTVTKPPKKVKREDDLTDEEEMEFDDKKKVNKPPKKLKREEDRNEDDDVEFEDKKKVKKPPKKVKSEDLSDEEEIEFDDKDEAFSADELSSDDDDKPRLKVKSEDQDSEEKKKSDTKSKKQAKPQKQMTERGKILKEHIAFKSSQQKYLPLVEEWKACLKAENTTEASQMVEKVLDVVEDFSASFMEFYHLSDLLKRTKQLFKQQQGDLKSWASLREKMKSVYAEKSVLVPKGFTPKVSEPENNPKVVKFEKTKDEELTEKSDPVIEAKSPPRGRDAVKVETMPKSQSSTSLDNVSKKIKAEVKSESKAAPPSRSAVTFKKKFSLGSLMKTTSKEPEIRPATVPSLSQSSTSKSEKKVVDVTPSWVKDPPLIDAPKEDPRLFALEFLLQMAEQFPEGKVNIDSLARSIELVIYEWACHSVGVPAKKDASTWKERYWGKVHAIVAAVCGKREMGTLMNMILKGHFDSPEKLLDLSDDDLIASFESRPLNL